MYRPSVKGCQVSRENNGENNDDGEGLRAVVVCLLRLACLLRTMVYVGLLYGSGERTDFVSVMLSLGLRCLVISSLLLLLASESSPS